MVRVSVSLGWSAISVSNGNTHLDSHPAPSFLSFSLLKVIYFFILHRGELISLGDIENIHKKRKHDKESRLETVIVSSDYNVDMWYVESSWS